MYIENYQNIVDKLNCKGAWTFEEITEIKYNIEPDYEDNYIMVLDLTFKVEIIKTKQCFKLKKRYYNVSDFSLKKVTKLYLTNSLIIWNVNTKLDKNYRSCCLNSIGVK